MRYHAHLTDANFSIPADALDLAYATLCNLNTDDSIKGGSSSVPGYRTHHFSWMDADYPDKCEDAAAIFAELGFETFIDGDGALMLISYDSKIGDEEMFVAAVAPFVTPGSYMRWRGEDGEMWGWDFDGTSMIRRAAVVTWV